MKKTALIAFGVYLLFMTTLAALDVGAGKYDWQLIPLVIVVIAFPFVLGLMAGKDNE
jgi:hypothetical protein